MSFAQSLWCGFVLIEAAGLIGCPDGPAAEACPYANVCETCDNFMPTPDFVPVLQAQLADITELRADAKARGWTSEVDRHGRVIQHLEAHLERLERS